MFFNGKIHHDWRKIARHDLLTTATAAAVRPVMAVGMASTRMGICAVVAFVLLVSQAWAHDRVAHQCIHDTFDHQPDTVYVPTSARAYPEGPGFVPDHIVEEGLTPPPAGASAQAGRRLSTLGSFGKMRVHMDTTRLTSCVVCVCVYVCGREHVSHSLVWCCYCVVVVVVVVVRVW